MGTLAIPLPPLTVPGSMGGEWAKGLLIAPLSLASPGGEVPDLDGGQW